MCTSVAIQVNVLSSCSSNNLNTKPFGNAIEYSWRTMCSNLVCKFIQIGTLNFNIDCRSYVLCRWWTWIDSVARCVFFLLLKQHLHTHSLIQEITITLWQSYAIFYCKIVDCVFYFMISFVLPLYWICYFFDFFYFAYFFSGGT